MERYLRNIPALTPEDCALLNTKKVAVIGCGGLGGYLLELLGRLGVGQLVAVDGDVFEESNLNRQLLSRTELLGTSKAEAAKARMASVNPEISVTAVPCFLTRENARELIAGCHAVMDGLDSIPARRILAEACAEADIPYIYGAIGGWTAQAAAVMPGDKLIDLLYPKGASVKDKSALSFTPALCAAMQAALCVRVLTGMPVERGRLQYADLRSGEFETLFLG